MPDSPRTPTPPRPRTPQAGLAPSEAACALLDECLADDPKEARGVGCDNMTAVVVKLNMGGWLLWRAEGGGGGGGLPSLPNACILLVVAPGREGCRRARGCEPNEEGSMTAALVS